MNDATPESGASESITPGSARGGVTDGPVAGLSHGAASSSVGSNSLGSASGIGSGRSTARIEGGIDAVVVGASFNGLAAAALMAKSGLRVILVEAGLRAIEPEPREFAPGFFCDDGDGLIYSLDPELLATVDFYRFGLSFARRRMATIYVDEEGGAFKADGDPAQIGLSTDEQDDIDGEDVNSVFGTLLHGGRSITAMGANEASLSSISALDALGLLPAHAYLQQTLKDEKAIGYLLAEASLRRSARPDDPMSALALAARWSGEVAGLQGAVAYPAGGHRGLIEAARRAAQSFGVDYRQTGGVQRIIVEWDQVAGLEFEDGGQIRTPIVVTALDARTAFSRHIGAARMDIEFLHRIPSVSGVRDNEKCFLKAHLAFKSVPDVLREGQYGLSRFVFTPSLDSLYSAHSAARTGAELEGGVMEFFLPSLSDGKGDGERDGVRAPSGGATGLAVFGPVSAAHWSKSSEHIVSIIRTLLDRLSQGFGDALTAAHLVPQKARPPVLSELSLAKELASSNQIGGYFFCGPEVELGLSPSGAAGRRAAEAAIRYLKKGG